MNATSIIIRTACLFASSSWCLPVSTSAQVSDASRHYIFFNRDRERITEPSFLSAKGIEGAQLKFTWRELEPDRDEYDFGSVSADLETLRKAGKKLWIQLQDASFDDKIINVPKYLLDESRFHGGLARQFTIKNDDDSKATPAGWVARRWDPAVQDRFGKLLAALGKEFDGKIAGINLPETSVDFGASGKLYPDGFTPRIYRAAIVTNMVLLKRAFPHSVAMQYANFMPGEWLPEDDHGLLASVYQQAVQLNVAVGGPDLLPFKPGQMKHAYPLIRNAAGKIPAGIAVQWGNYEHTNPKTGKRITVPELANFAATNLNATFIFWSTQEPFYSQEVLPYLRKSETP